MKHLDKSIYWLIKMSGFKYSPRTSMTPEEKTGRIER